MQQFQLFICALLLAAHAAKEDWSAKNELNSTSLTQNFRDVLDYLHSAIHFSNEIPPKSKDLRDLVSEYCSGKTLTKLEMTSRTWTNVATVNRRKKSEILYKFLGKWKRQTPNDKDLLLYQRMLNVALDESKIPTKGLVEKSMTIGAMCKPTILIERSEVSDALTMKVMGFDLTDTNYDVMMKFTLSNILLQAAKGKRELWNFSSPNKSVVQGVNGLTSRVCGMEITDNGIKFGYLQCKNENDKFKSCTHYIEVSKDLEGENKFIHMLDVYYLREGAAELIQGYFGTGEKCRALSDRMYTEYSKIKFNWIK